MRNWLYDQVTYDLMDSLVVSKGLIRFNNDIGMVKVIGLVLEGNLVVKVLINREFGYVKVCLDCGVVVEELGRSL